MQELSNGNRVISWGHNWNPMVTEVRPNDSIAIDLSYQNYIDTYRAFKYQWETNLFTTNTDSLDFGNVSVGDSSEKVFTLFNPQDSLLMINEFYCSDSSFTTKVSLPISIQPRDSLMVPVIFKPKRNGTFNVTFNIRNFSQYQGQSQMIARQVILIGTSGNISAINSNKILPNQFALFQNYPNPFNPSTTIRFTLPTNARVSIRLYNTLGQEVVKILNNEQINAGQHETVFNASNFSSGIYFYRLEAKGEDGSAYVQTKRMVLVK